MEIVEYLTEEGRSPFADWFDALHSPADAKVTTAIVRLGQGNTSNVEGVGGGVFESKIDVGPGYRVYFGMDGTIWSSWSAAAASNSSHGISSWPKPAGTITGGASGQRIKGVHEMTLTRNFRETVMARVKRDPAFRGDLLIEATNAFLEGDLDTGKSLLRDYLNATEALPAIAEELQLNEKSIRRMLGPKGNPTLKNFINLLSACSRLEHLRLAVCRH
jgi:putative addiction module killer protein